MRWVHALVASGSSRAVRGTGRIAGRELRDWRFIPACAGNSSAIRESWAASTVHPRVCGEQMTIPDHKERMNGSSPRVRGTVRAQPRALLGIRFIPARAGNRAGRGSTAMPPTVHPRVCGEQTDVASRNCVAVGSSPACAGNSPATDPGDRSRPVHPRVCGEQVPACAGSYNVSGSSPRVRGTVTATRRLLPEFRFIPACAGNSDNAVECGDGPAVHPRVCGEQVAIVFVVAGPSGSSPRVRGTGRWDGASRSSIRFIPACAGNRRLSRAESHRKPVHPRVCGEQPLAVLIDISNRGSSPRVRGTDEAVAFPHVEERFIPACAGNRDWGTLREKPHAVHPRVCGEQAAVSQLIQKIRGSSPRVRGTAAPLFARMHGNAADGSSPRVRGTGWLMRVTPAVYARGSSPRVRGTGTCSDTRVH